MGFWVFGVVLGEICQLEWIELLLILDNTRLERVWEGFKAERMILRSKTLIDW